MSHLIASIASYLSRDLDTLDAVSQNVANMRTNGYRAERMAQTGFLDGVADNGHVLDLADGNLEVTGVPLDLAMRGDGFFVVDAGGQNMLTRGGQFRVAADGTLVDALGHAVLGQAGPIVLAHPNVQVSSSGEIRDGKDIVDTLRIVAVDDPRALKEAGDGLYRLVGTAAQWTGTVHQGALERSNVDPSQEMVRLMSLTRHAQSLQHAVQAYDAAMQNGINHLGDNS